MPTTHGDLLTLQRANQSHRACGALECGFVLLFFPSYGDINVARYAIGRGLPTYCLHRWLKMLGLEEVVREQQCPTEFVAPPRRFANGTEVPKRAEAGQALGDDDVKLRPWH